MVGYIGNLVLAHKEINPRCKPNKGFHFSIPCNSELVLIHRDLHLPAKKEITTSNADKDNPAKTDSLFLFEII